MTAAKTRLDQRLVADGLADSGARAQAIIRAGQVRVDGEVVDKPGTPVAATARVEVVAGLPYVGRGGFKLAAALDAFGVNPSGRVCLDVGASTGGFTDVLLQRGAARVVAVDVGRGQLAWKLRQDPRVLSLERTDIRSLPDLEVRPSLATVDVAFISLKNVLPSVARQLGPGGCCIALVKPQFEAGRADVPRGGVVIDPGVRRRAFQEVVQAAIVGGWTPIAAMPSPVVGASGNREMLLLLHLAPPDKDVDIDALAEAAIG